MIYMYNEVDSPQWGIETREDSKGRQYNTLTNLFYSDLKIDIKRGLDLDSFKFDPEKDSSNTEEIYTLSDVGIVLGIDRKNFHPYIAPIPNVRKNDEEVFLATFNLNSSDRILNMFIRDGHIIKYVCDIKSEGKRISVVFTLNRHRDNAVPRFTLTLRDEEWKNVYKREITIDMKSGDIKVFNRQYPFNKAKNDRYVNVTDISINEGTDINVMTYIPLRPTQDIYLPKGQDGNLLEEILEERYHFYKDKKNYPNIITNGDEIDIKQTILDLTFKGHTAITYFIGDKTFEDIKNNMKEVSQDLDNNKFGKEFSHVLVLTGDGKIARIKG